MTHHIIRLRGAWTREQLPTDRVRLIRPFGRPRTLDANETVWLVGQHAPGDGSVTLNGDVIGSIRVGEPFAFEVTNALRIRNSVAIEVDLSQDTVPDDVALEFRTGAIRATS